MQLEGDVIMEKWSEMEEGNHQLWNFRYVYKLEKAKERNSLLIASKKEHSPANTLALAY